MSSTWWQNRRMQIGFLLALPIILLVVLSRQVSWRPKSMPGLGGAVTAIAYSPDGRIHCATDNNFVQVWRPDIARWRSYIKPMLSSNLASPTFLHFYESTGHSSGPRLIAGGANSAGNFTSNPTIVWDGNTRKPLFSAGYSSGGGLAISADGTTLAAATLAATTPGNATAPHNEIYVYNLLARPVSQSRGDDPRERLPMLIKPGTLLGPKSGLITALAFSPDGTTLAGTSGASQPISLWDMATRKLRAQFTPPPANNGTPYGSAYSNLPSTSGLPGARDSALTFAPDNKSLIRSTVTGAVERWDIASGQLAASIAANTTTNALVSFCQATFSPDGTQLATGDGASIVVRDPQTLREIRRLNIGGPFAFSPDGSTLATGNNNAHEILLWRIR